MLNWYGGQQKTLWVFSRTALWYTPRLPPVALHYVLVADPEGKRRMEAFFCTGPEATPLDILQWVVMRWSVELTFEESRAHLCLQTQRQWSDRAVARTTPILLAAFSLVTVMALQLSPDGQIPVSETAWYYKAEPTFADCLALVRQHLWRAQVFGELLLTGLLLRWPKWPKSSKRFGWEHFHLNQRKSQSSMRAEGDVVFEVLNYEGVPVILSRETWQAKAGDGEIGSHPEISGYLDDVKAAIGSPDLVF